ncbi:hypothetical protein GOBAR_AA27857 [Gossypium barbadense]|uniref:Tyrosine-protein phosphatase domain-containing protein n=1 Tax=Gossypium barbadense TaxID=3634 RepID=A0A2P5WNY9_GOSBA|nr:hypothetical protein GOBAR_AA27857 [Gossypium barbadense]
MRKRERENPCGICGHYHKFEEGEVCGVWGHRAPVSPNKTSLQVSAFPSVILPDFLYLGSYDNASRSELLKTQGITRVLNSNVREIRLESSSPAIVIAYLMKSKGWRLQPSYQWVKERRSSVELSQDAYQQLQEYEQKLFGSCDNSNLAGAPSFNFGFSNPSDPLPLPVPIPAFNNLGATSIFARPPPFEVPPHGFTFGSDRTQRSMSENLSNPSGSDIPMDSS